MFREVLDCVMGRLGVYEVFIGCFMGVNRLFTCMQRRRRLRGIEFSNCARLNRDLSSSESIVNGTKPA